jgi:ribosomal protein L7/L12
MNIESFLLRTLDSILHANTLDDAKACAKLAISQWQISKTPGQIERLCIDKLAESRIAAVKTHRELTGSSLKEALNYIDNLKSKLNI